MIPLIVPRKENSPVPDQCQDFWIMLPPLQHSCCELQFECLNLKCITLAQWNLIRHSEYKQEIG